jgi:hypothetical protein
MNTKLLNQIKESSLRSATDFVNTYAKNEDTIVNDFNEFEGIKAEFYCQDFFSAIDTTKFLSIYSDITSIFMLPHQVKDHLIHYYSPEDPLFIQRHVTFPTEVLKGFVPQPHQILTAYTTQNDIDIKDVCKRLMPLIERGKFVIRPIRTIILENPSLKPQTDRVIYYANSDTPNNHWQIKSLNEKDSYVIDSGLKNYQSNLLYEITLPYIKNVSIDSLTKIIDDESEILATFRLALKDLMLQSVTSDKALINEIRNDKIRPQIETINRKFNTIKNIHKLSIGASVTAITISLLAIVTNSGTNFQTLFNPIVGGGAIGMLASEIKFQTEEDKLKDNPYFLLWKISKANHSKILKQF